VTALPSNRPLKVGIFVTAMAGGMRDGALRWNDLRQMAERAEELGFDSFWVPDHLIFKPEGEKPHGPWECWSLIAALAASTSRMELGSLVTCVPFRNPGLLAKMADTIDEISGGRLILGLGAGWHEPEFDAFGYPFDHRFERFEESLHIIRTLLKTGAIDHEGSYYTLRECELRPRGPRPGGPPMMIGALATKKRMLNLIARYADIWNGWLLHSRSHPDEVPQLTGALDEACATAGRDPATIGRSIGIMIDQRAASERPQLPGSSKAEFLTGTNEEIAESLRAFAGHGIDHIQVTTAIQGVAGIEALAPVLDLLDRG
jgi:alkanesulfonate monooxygenase SsuD/methylene tetrahydromethanopterin reductase-like flavin-dependent oxidoreductase (luciferase family)